MSLDTFIVNGNSFNYALLIKRFQSNFIDLWVIMIVILLSLEISQHLGSAEPLFKWTTLVFALLYVPAMTSHSATIGQRLIGVRVRKSDDPLSRISFPLAVWRFVLKTFLGIVSFFTINFSDKHKAIHDLAAGTVVIKTATLRSNRFSNFLGVILYCIVIGCSSSGEKAPQWERIFNGKNLDGWEIKIAGHEVGDNYLNTFRAEQGMIRISYGQYETFDDKYGHMYYHKPYSNYRLRYDYRFVGNQVEGGEVWNVRNSGIMVHSQSAQSNDFGQHFPVSIEMQLLGGLGEKKRATGNLCTPGTAVVYRKKTDFTHCINSSSVTYHGDQWVNAEIIVWGDSVIHQLIEGDTVLTYYEPTIGGGMISQDTTFQQWKQFGVENYRQWEDRAGELLSSGYIALQAESHGIDFRNLELMELK